MVVGSLLEGVRRAQYQILAVHRPDQLQPDRQAVLGEAAGQGHRRLLRQIEGEGERRPPGPVFFACRALRREHAGSERRDCGRRCKQQLVLLVKALHLLAQRTARCNYRISFSWNWYFVGGAIMLWSCREIENHASWCGSSLSSYNRFSWISDRSTNHRFCGTSFQFTMVVCFGSHVWANNYLDGGKDKGNLIFYYNGLLKKATYPTV